MHVLIVTFFSYMFRRLLHHLQGELSLYAQNCFYVLWLQKFATFIQLVKKITRLVQR
jgi:hypothetical protein